MTDELTEQEEFRLRQEVSNLTAMEILEINLIERMLDLTPVDTLTIKLGALDRSPKKNWVENVGGLPKYIEKVAKSLHEKRGMTISRAIATAISRIKVWARGGDNVDPDTQAKAAKALAEWNAKRARSKAK
jgi:hypothetical protein